MFRAIFTVSGLTLMSRVLGFVRDKLIATHLGADAMADVWFAAFKLPNLFRRVFGEGAFNAAFVPMYSRRLEEGGEEKADLFARRTLSVMAVILLTLFVLCFIFMEPLTRVMNIGYEKDGRLEPAVAASRITVGYLVFICLVAALSGILNSRRVFGAPAFAYVVLNLVFLASLAVIVPRTEDPVTTLSWTVMVAGVLQLAVVGAACLRRGVKLAPRLPVIDDDIKRLGLLMAPGLVSASIQQINLIVGQTVASLELGGQALIAYSDRINQLPLGLIGMAAAVVLLPEITRNLRGGDEDAARGSLRQGVEMSMLLCLPAMAAMLAIPGEIMFAIFEGGAFRAESAREAGRVLMAFAPGAPAYVLVKVLQPGYFAREDTRTPMKFTIATAVVNMALCWPLFVLIGVPGCALATSVAGWVNVLLLTAGLRRKGFLFLDARFFGRQARILLSALLMAAAVWGMAWLARDWLFAEGRFFLRIAVLAVLAGAGALLYFALAFATRVLTIDQAKRLWRGRNSA